MFRVWGVALMVLIAAGAALCQSRTAELRARFNQETNPVRKAKLMRDLGEAELKDIDRDLDAGKVSDAAAAFERYRDEVRSCEQALDTMGSNAEKHSSGFKQLEISVRESLRRLDSIIPTLTGDQQSRFVAVRGDLSQINQHLLQELFPHAPSDGGTEN
jgi:chromosome segregation ATPase